MGGTEGGSLAGGAFWQEKIRTKAKITNFFILKASIYEGV